MNKPYVVSLLTFFVLIHFGSPHAFASTLTENEAFNSLPGQNVSLDEFNSQIDALGTMPGATVSGEINNIPNGGIGGITSGGITSGGNSLFPSTIHSALPGFESITQSSPYDAITGNSLFDFCPTNSFDFPFVSAVEELNGTCLSNQSSGMFGPDYSRDLAVCSCLQRSSPPTAERMTYSMGRLADNSSSLNSLTQEAMNENISRMNRMLEAEQNAMHFQASTLPSSDEQSGALISAFTSRVNFNVGNHLSAIQRQAESAYNTYSDPNAPGSRRMNQIIVPRPDADLLVPSAAANQQTSCIPLRTFMTARQMPLDPAFAEDVSSLPQQFQESEWNYHQLQIRLLQRARTLRTNTLDQTLTDPEAKKIHQRLQFLQRNPLYRNLFSSTHPERGPQQQRLWEMIRNTYRPGQSRDDQFKAFNRLRYDSGAFFTAPNNIVDIVQSGASANLKNLMDEVPLRVSRISQTYNPSLQWSISRSLEGTSEEKAGVFSVNLNVNDPNYFLNQNSGRRNISIYEHYCPRLEFASQQNQFTVLKELEEDFGSTYTSAPLGNKEYYMANVDVCGTERMSSDGRTKKTWPVYHSEICQGRTTGECHPENQGALLANFLDEFPDPSSPNIGSTREQLSYLLPFLRGEARIPNATRASAERSLAEGSQRNYMSSPRARSLRTINEEFTRNSAELRNNPQRLIPSSSSVATVSRSTTQVTRPSGPSASTAPASFNSPSANSAASFAPAASAASSVVVPSPQTQGLRTQARQKESEVETIRDQLSSLRGDLERENARTGATRDQSAIRDLNTRLAQLERQLGEKEREAEDLRQRVRRSEALDQTRSSAVANTSRVDDRQETRRNQELPVSNAATSNAQMNQGQMTGPQNSASGGQAQLSPEVGRVSGPRAGGGTSGGELLRSKYNIEAVSSEGVIVVSGQSAPIDYQQLREDSGSNVINVPLTSSEFQALPESAKDQYLSQVNALSADVVRVAFSDGEGFFVRDGDQFALVPAQQAEVNRAPAAVDRTTTLDDLNRELGNSR